MTTGEREMSEGDNFYTLVPEQGMCLIGDIMVNLRRVTVIRRLDGKTLVYHSGVSDPIILPLKAFDQIRDAVFAVDDDTDDDEEEEFEDDE